MLQALGDHLGVQPHEVRVLIAETVENGTRFEVELGPAAWRHVLLSSDPYWELLVRLSRNPDIPNNTSAVNGTTRTTSTSSLASTLQGPPPTGAAGTDPQLHTAEKPESEVKKPPIVRTVIEPGPALEYMVRYRRQCYRRPKKACYKPVIYLFPPSQTGVTVHLSLTPHWNFSAVYPSTVIRRSSQGETVEWQVTAKPGSFLVDHEGTESTYLFWEGGSQAQKQAYASRVRTWVYHLLTTGYVQAGQLPVKMRLAVNIPGRRSIRLWHVSVPKTLSCCPSQSSRLICIANWASWVLCVSAWSKELTVAHKCPDGLHNVRDSCAG